MITPATLAVIVGGSTLRERALLVHQRALLPIRAVAEALGARVDYRSATRTIVVNAPGRPPITLRIGSRTAYVGAQAIALDVGAQLYAEHAYVPIRFLAAELNVPINYENAARAVVISSASLIAHSDLAPGISGLVPLPNSTNASAFPVVGANIDAPNVAPSAIRLLLDNVDVTANAERTANGILYLPTTPLSVGAHVASISLDGGASIAQKWFFATSVSAAVATPQPAQPFYTPVQQFPQLQFFVVGSTALAPGSSAQVEMVAPPNGDAYAQSCYSGWNYPLYPSWQNPGIYDGWIPVPYVHGTQFCSIEGFYVDSLGYRYQAPFSVDLTIFGPEEGHHPRPTPTPQPYFTPNPGATPIVRRTPSPASSCPPGRRCLLQAASPQPSRPPFDGGVHRPWPSPRPFVRITPHPTVRVTPHPTVRATVRPAPRATSKPAPRATSKPAPRTKSTPPPHPKATRAPE